MRWYLFKKIRSSFVSVYTRVFVYTKVRLFLIFSCVSQPNKRYLSSYKFCLSFHLLFVLLMESQCCNSD